MPTLDSNNNIVISTAEFKEKFSAFADMPDNEVANALSEAECYISNKYSGDISFDCRALMIELMAAHLLAVSANSSNPVGGIAGQIVQAHIEQVSVSAAIPKNSNPFQYFLNQSAYGQKLLALIQSKITPMLFGGSFQRVFR
jgi:hypothetical protein